MDDFSPQNILEQFQDLTVLIIGDVMVDAYLWGEVSRISPEAPVPVVSVDRKEDRLGGAANVALNTHALGAKTFICSVISDDQRGEEFCELLGRNDLSREGMVKSDQRRTSIKTRIISNSQQMLRVDEETTDDLQPEEEEKLLKRAEKLLDKQPDVIIFEDYNKGILTKKVISGVIQLAREKGIPTAVDPKLKNFFEYKGVTLFKPNLKELREGLNIAIDAEDLNALKEAETELRKRLGHDISLITLSSKGVFIGNDKAEQILPAHIRNISDVSGAGDTVISVAALGLALKLPPNQMALLANLAGGLVCEKVGVVPIDKAQLQEEASSLKPTS